MATLPKVDFDGADLQGAEFTEAQLQGASLKGAQLHGAGLEGAQLQGATLDRAQLQGATLDRAQLQGASLDNAQLQGASLNCAISETQQPCTQLQGASLYGAQLQGATLHGARLQGAWLEEAHIQGASLEDAQLQGASLENADLEGTDLSRAYLWRTNRTNNSVPPAAVSAIRVSSSDEMWLPVRMEQRAWLPEWIDQNPWDGRAYQDLRTTIEALPPGLLRIQALDRIQSLDCGKPDPTLASCDPSAALPAGAAAWRKQLEAANMGEQAYLDARAKTLKELVCSGYEDSIYIARGHGFQGALYGVGDLIDELMNRASKDCPVATALTDDDRENLLQIKQRIKEAAEAAYSP